MKPPAATCFCYHPIHYRCLRIAGRRLDSLEERHRRWNGSGGKHYLTGHRSWSRPRIHLDGSVWSSALIKFHMVKLETQTRGALWCTNFCHEPQSRMKKVLLGFHGIYHRPSVHLRRHEEYLKFFCRTCSPMYLSDKSMMSYIGCMRLTAQSQQLTLAALAALAALAYCLRISLGAQVLDTHSAWHATASATPAALLSLKSFVQHPSADPN